jgi:hypothetical protein
MNAPEPNYLEPYAAAIREHGGEFPSLLFRDRESQLLRFSVLALVAPMAERRIADLGSGRGDLLAWLYTNDVPYGHYLGVEAMPEFDEAARTRMAAERMPDADFLLADFVADEGLFERIVAEHDLDTLVFSGSLNTLGEAQALAVLERAWLALAGRPGATLAFNFLVTGTWPQPFTDLTRRDPAVWLAWAIARTPLVAYCQYYLGGHDGTLVMVRPA